MNAFPHERRHRKRIKPITIFILSLIITLFMAGSYLYYSCQREYQAQLKSIKIYGKYFSQKTTLTFENFAQSLYILSSVIKWQNGKTDYYEDIARYLIKIIPETININLAKNGIVSHVYPYEQNKKALGHNLLLSQSRRDEALLAIATKKVTIAGPFTLIQGGGGLAFRQAVFLPVDPDNKEQQLKTGPTFTKDNEYFWGFVLITYDFPKIMERLNYEVLTMAGLSWNLWHFSPSTGKKQTIISSDSVLGDNPQTFTIPVQNATWFLDIAPSTNPYKNSKILLDGLLYCFICILLSLLFTFVIILNTKNKIIQRQSRTDTLTNLPNRKWFYTLLHTALTKHFETQYQQNDPRLFICVLDLNDFKKINDTYGHILGDKILIEFAKRLSNSLLPNEMASRLGGDEFLAVYYCIPNEAETMPARLIEIQNYLQQPYTVSDQPYNITVSIGYITPDKESLKEKDPKISDEEFFLDQADRIMYENKRRHHQMKENAQQQ